MECPRQRAVPIPQAAAHRRPSRRLVRTSRDRRASFLSSPKRVCASLSLTSGPSPSVLPLDSCEMSARAPLTPLARTPRVPPGRPLSLLVLLPLLPGTLQQHSPWCALPRLFPGPLADSLPLYSPSTASPPRRTTPSRVTTPRTPRSPSPPRLPPAATARRTARLTRQRRSRPCRRRPDAGGACTASRAARA